MIRAFVFQLGFTGACLGLAEVAHFSIFNTIKLLLCSIKNVLFKSFLLVVFLCFYVICFSQIPTTYNIVWNSQSKNASESMPCGGGDIGMNVWVENGEVYIYVAKSGNFNEENALLKTGRIKVVFSPNPFVGNTFRQELHLNEGFVSVFGQSNGVSANIKIWADVKQPVAHFEVECNKKISVNATYQSWRYEDRVLQKAENFGNSYKWTAPINNTYKKDSISFLNNQVLFYHYNADSTIFDKTVAQQGLYDIKNQLFNPLKKLAFGGLFAGDNFIAHSVNNGNYQNTNFKGWSLQSKSKAKKHNLQLFLYNNQVANISDWLNQLDSLKQQYKQSIETINNSFFWTNFWSRSFIILNENDSNSIEWQVGRNYQLFRYMLAANSTGSFPTKFNGGLFTVDPLFTDTSKKLTPDFRNWGGGTHTAQNQRLVYFPMIKNGDWDLLQPQLNFYLNILKNAEQRSNVYWNHSGACFTEQLENFGLPNYAEYGQKRPAIFDKGVEYNAWLEYTWDTVLEFCLMMLEEQLYTNKNIENKIPFIESCLTFFDEHYQYLAKQRGRKALDENGKLVLYPTSAAETFKMATNSTTTVAALQTIAKRLLQLPTKYLTNEKRLFWTGFLSRIPDLPFSNVFEKTTIAPAKTWERINNIESPQLYPVYPWHIFGLNKPGLDTAINTWNLDSNVVKFKSFKGWKQDNIWAANLGLKKEAWELTSKKLLNGNYRFPAFWGPGFDWLPDFNWGGSGMIGLQDMLMQVDDKKIFLFPTWQKNKDVYFKLHAPYNTTVEVELKNEKIISLKVFPVERLKDVVNMMN